MTAKKIKQTSTAMLTDAQMKAFYKVMKMINCEDNKADLLAGYGCQSTKEMTKAQMADLLGKLYEMLPQDLQAKQKASLRKLSPEEKAAQEAKKEEADRKYWEDRCVDEVSRSLECRSKPDPKAYARQIIGNQSSKKAINEISLPMLKSTYHHWKRTNDSRVSIETVAKAEELTMAQLN